LCDKSANGITIVENGKIIYLNEKVSEIFGYTQDELLKSPGMEYNIPNEKKILLEQIKESQKNDIPLNLIEFWIRLKNNKRKCVQNRYFTDTINNKNYRYIITTDITDFKIMIEELKKHQEFLENLVKMLGIEENTINNLNNEDLFAIISGNIEVKEKIESESDTFNGNTSVFKIRISPSISDEEKNLVFLTSYVWDKKFGPELDKIYPQEKNPPFNIEEIGVQLFHAAVSIYGNEYIDKSQGLLLKIENINSYGYVYFDVIRRELEISRFMIAVIAPKINYFETLKIKHVLQMIGNEIKEKVEWDIKSYWEKILKILTNPQF